MTGKRERSMKKFFIHRRRARCDRRSHWRRAVLRLPRPGVHDRGPDAQLHRFLGAPAGTTTTETNPDYKGARAAVVPPAATASTSAAAGDWPSYNRTVDSDRFSPLGEITTANVGKLKVLCTYDVGGYEAFESGLIMVNDALIGTTEFDIFSLNPATCALNWRTHEDYPPALLPSNRGAAYWDGMLFRGTQDGRVMAYDFKSGKRIWETRIADPKNGESVPAAPIAHDSVVYIGNAGGDFKGGKGKMYALDAKTGKILWQFFMVPQSRRRRGSRTPGQEPARRVDVENGAGHTHQRWRPLDVLHARYQDRPVVPPRRQSGP